MMVKSTTELRRGAWFRLHVQGDRQSSGYHGQVQFYESQYQELLTTQRNRIACKK